MGSEAGGGDYGEQIVLGAEVYQPAFDRERAWPDRGSQVQGKSGV